MSRLEKGSYGLDRQPAVSKEAKERQASVGVAVLIVGLDPSRNGANESDPLIWTLTELRTKIETDKTAGQTSIPAETRKNGESIENNVLGALGEFCDDTLFEEYIRRHMIKIDGRWHRERGITMIGERPADVAVLIYDGALDFPFKPVFPDEVSPNGWMKKSELEKKPGLRDALRQTLELDDRENLIRNAIENYQNNPEARKSVFPDGFDSIQSFINGREFGIDVETLPWDCLEVGKRLPEAHRLIVDSISLLVEAQSQGRRDYKRESKIVSDLEKALRDMERLDYAVGIGELSGLGIRKVGVPKGGFKSWGERREELVRENQNPKSIHYSRPDEFQLSSATTSIENKKCWGSWELQRGDELGYPEELGKNWYLLFFPVVPNRSGYDGYGIIPVNGIKNLELRPYDAHGM